jgi:Flp pilus assembly protein TadD
MLGTILKQQRATDEALTAFRNAVKYRPTSAEAYLSLGQMLGQAGQQAEAAAAMQEAERLNRRKADEQASTFAVAVGIQKLEAKDIAGAIERFREAIRLFPENARARYQLALALQRTGARSEAQAQFAEARRLAPYLPVPPASSNKR